MLYCDELLSYTSARRVKTLLTFLLSFFATSATKGWVVTSAKMFTMKYTI